MKGKVVDADNLQPVANALITQGEEQTYSDINGLFTVSSLSPIRISSIGYRTQVVEVDPNQKFQVFYLTPNVQELNEIVISAFESNESLLESAGSVSLLTPKDLKRDNESNISQTLNRVAGVYMHSGTYNTNRLTIRGIGSRTPFSTNKIRAYYEEIPLTTGEGETIIEDIDMGFLERMEVIKGPASSLYGAGLGGTILLEASSPESSKVTVENNTMLGSFGLWRNQTAFKSSGAQSQIYVGYSQMSSEGYRENNEYDRQSFLLATNFYPNEKATFHLLGNYIDVKGFIPSSINEETFRNNPRAAAGNWLAAEGFESYQKGLVGASLDYQFLPNLEQKTSLFTSFRLANEPRPFNILRENTLSYGLRSRLIYSPNLGNWETNFTIGTEYFNEYYFWQTYENNNRTEGAILTDNTERRNCTNLFAQALLKPLKRLNITLGLNYNEMSYRLTDLFTLDSLDQSGKYEFEPVWSPRLGINYRISDKIALFAQVAHGFSPPSVEETLTPEGQINPQIQPETGWNYELGSRGQAGFFAWEVALFNMQIENLLVARRTAEDAFVGLNAGSTQHRGIELQTNFFPLKSHPDYWQFSLTYTYSDYTFQDFLDEDAGEDFSGNVLPGIAPHILNLVTDWNLPFGLYGNLNYQFVDEMFLRDDNILKSESYQVLNLKLGYEMHLGQKWYLDFHAGIQNLADERYASMLLVNAGSFGGNAPRYFYPGLARNYFGGLKIKFTH
ncbi:MAG: TonB-dependent receptor [Bacteroidota bacterium]